MGKRSEQIDVTRGILILLMIMGHVKFGTVFDKYIHMFHMPFWFFLTGWFSQNRNEPFHVFFKRKAKTLLLPYFLCGLFHYPLWILLVRNHSESVVTPIKSLFWVNTSNHLPIANALWFLPCLFFAQLLFEVFRKVCKTESGLYFCCAVAALVGCLLPISVSSHIPWALAPALPGCGLIALGFGFSGHRDAPSIHRLLHMPIPVWVAGIIGNAALCFLNGSVNMRTGEYAIVPLTWFNAFSSILLFWNLGEYLITRVGKLGSCRFMVKRLELMGRNSIVYLCWNQLALVISKQMLSGTAADGMTKLLYRLLLLLLTLFLLYGAEKLYTGAWKEKQGSFAPWRMDGPIQYVLILMLLLASFAALKRQEQQRIYNRIVVSAPQINGIFPDRNGDNAALKGVLRDNAIYLADVQWNMPNRYAYCPSSNLLKAKQPNILQAFLIHLSWNSFRNWEKEETLYVVNAREGMSREQAIRPWAHTCFVMANAVRLGITDAARTEELEKKACMLIEALSEAHVSNSRTGWGNSWQSAEWAENIGYAAWLLWDSLSQDGQFYVYQMVKYEADRFMNYTIPYYRNRDGEIVYKGDTKAEETAWNSRVLALAVCMFPEEPHCSEWERQMEKLLIASGAAPSDVNSNLSVDGLILREVLNGSNINEDGTVVNHQRVHLDYIATTMEGMLDTAIIYALAGRTIPEASIFGFERMYEGLVTVDLGIYDSDKTGHHFFERENESPASSVNMPGENDWGGNWYPEYYLIDTAVELFELDHSLNDSFKASNWADIHLQVLATMSDREGEQKKRGQFFLEGENNFISGETYQMHNLSKAYLLRLLNSQGKLKFKSQENSYPAD